MSRYGNKDSMYEEVNQIMLIAKYFIENQPFCSFDIYELSFGRPIIFNSYHWGFIYYHYFVNTGNIYEIRYLPHKTVEK